MEVATVDIVDRVGVKDVCVYGTLVFHRHHHYVLVISSPLICPPYALDTTPFWYLRTETNSRNSLDIRLMPSLHECERSYQGPRTGTADKAGRCQKALALNSIVYSHDALSIYYRCFLNCADLLTPMVLYYGFVDDSQMHNSLFAASLRCWRQRSRRGRALLLTHPCIR